MARVFTVDQAAEYLQVSPYTIREWLRKGRIRGSKLGRIYRILETDLEQCFQHHPESVDPGDVPGHTENSTPWEALSPEERKKRVDASLGMFAGRGRSVDDLMREKHEETLEEERRWQLREWQGLSREQKLERIRAVRGKYAHVPFSSDDLIAERRNEVEREERG